MSRKIGKDSNCLDLYLFVLCRQNVKFDAVKYCNSYIVIEQLLLGYIVKQQISYARNSIQNKFFVFIDCSFVYRFDEACNELTISFFEAHEIFGCVLFFCGEIGKKFNYLGYGVFEVASTELFIFFRFCIFQDLFDGSTIKILIEVEQSKSNHLAEAVWALTKFSPCFFIMRCQIT